jgi:hypothetical protein
MQDIIEQLDAMEKVAKEQQEAIARCREQLLAHDYKGAKHSGKTIIDSAKASYGYGYQFERDIQRVGADR